MLLVESAGAAAAARQLLLARAAAGGPGPRVGVTSRARVTRDRAAAEDLTPDVTAADPADVYVVVRPKNRRVPWAAAAGPVWAAVRAGCVCVGGEGGRGIGCREGWGP